MIGKCDIKGIWIQANFCRDLMLRLVEDIKRSGEGFSGMANHVRKQDDIKRIRRELMTLSKMLNPWEEGN